MSQFPYNHHLPGLRYNCPPHRTISPEQWLQSQSQAQSQSQIQNRTDDYLQEPDPFHSQSQSHFSQYNHYSTNSTRLSNNNPNVPTLTAAHPPWEVQIDAVPEQPSRVLPINHSDIAYPTQLNYHIPTQLPPPEASPQLDPHNHLHHPPPTLPRSPLYSSQPLPTPHWDDDNLYSLSDPHSSPSLPRPSSASASATPPTPLVKIEQEDGVDPFVMEPLSNGLLGSISHTLAPPTEVPLRATQASPQMRRMMNSFRLNPFSIHSGEGKRAIQPTYSGREAHPLDEEPLVFEFQLKLDGVEDPEDEEEDEEGEGHLAEPLRTLSPEYELRGEERGYGGRGEWEEEYTTESVGTASSSTENSTSTPPTWELEYPASPSGSATHSRASSTSRLHHVASHPYLRKPNSRETSESYDQHHPSTYSGRDYTHTHHHTHTNTYTHSHTHPHTHTTRIPDASHSIRSHSRTGAALRSSTYNFDDSPAFNASMLPSVAAASRRWSLPDNSPYPHAPFLVQG